MYESDEEEIQHTGNPVMFTIVTVFLLATVTYFGWQTWALVDWLFPSDMLMMKILTVVMFDVASLIWTATHLFYAHARPGSETLAKCGAIIDFILSLLATICYFVVQNLLKFHFPFTKELTYAVDILVILATVINVIFAVCWWSIEWSARHQKRGYLPNKSIRRVQHPNKSIRHPETVVEEVKTDALPANKTDELPTNKNYSPPSEEEDVIPTANKKKVKSIPKSRGVKTETM